MMRLQSSWTTVRVGLIFVCLSGILFLIAADSSARIASQPLTSTTTVAAADSTQQLQNAVHRLNAWLSRSKESTGWRRALLLNVLDTQSALGEQANVSVLQTIHSRFERGTAGLDHPAFRDVRVALAQQISQLSRTQFGDMFASVTAARGGYTPITISEMDHQRNQAKYQLQLVQKYYRETKSSYDRANLFYDLQLDQTIEFLDEIIFELAPEISEGKLVSMIREVRKQLDGVVNEIDAKPLTPEPDDEDTEEAEGQLEIIPSTQDPSADGPLPDNGERSLEELRKEEKKLEARIEELQEQRRAIAKVDKPRQQLRLKTFRQLRTFEANFVKQSKDLGDPYFVSALLAFERFTRTYYYGTQDNLQELFLKRLEDLESDLLELDGPDGRNAAGKVGDHLRWMENANQVPDLVTSIRAKYSNPNLYVSVSSRMLSLVANQSINNAEPIRQNLGGRLVRGKLYTNAQVSVELQDEPNQVHASIHLLGDITSQTYVQQGKIKAYASTVGQIEGRRSLYANVGGLYANDPKVAANIQADFMGTSSRLRIINKIAAKKFAELREESEGSAARQAEDRLLEQFQTQTDEPVGKGSEALADAQQELVSRANILPEIYLRSFSSEVMAVGKKSSISTLAAQTMPVASPISTDIAVRVHDSMLSNFLDRTFSGETFSDDQLASEIGSMFGQSPESLAASDKKDDSKDQPFKITFADVRPIQFEFEDNGFRVVASGKSFAQIDKKTGKESRINEGLRIILKFKIKQIGGKLTFVRDGKAEIDYLNPDQRKPTTVAFRSALLGKLNPELKEGEEDKTKQISAELPDNLLPIDQIEALKDSPIASKLVLVQCRSENGWLYLGWNHRAEDTYNNWQYDTPAIWNEVVISEMQSPYLNPAIPMNPQPFYEDSTIYPPANQPILNQPTLDQPILNQPIMNETILNQPIMNQPLMNQSVIIQSIQNQPVLYQPPSE